MQAVYYVNGSEVDTFINTIKKLVQDGEELTITVTSEGKAQLVTSIMDEKEQLFYSLFGSWQGNESGDEIVKQIYSDRVSGTRDIELQGFLIKNR